MKPDHRVMEALERAQAGIPLRKAECEWFLGFPEQSVEAGIMRAYASDILRRGNGNTAIMLGQIGIETDKCSGNCKFCTFGETHTEFPSHKLSREELEEKVLDFVRYGDLYGLFLMTMHRYDLEHFLDMARHARRIAPKTTQIWANVGDSERDALLEMKEAGVTGIYHVCRLREGEDTALAPKDRIRTMENALSAGLELYTCCEPIGPEHTPRDLVENMFIGIELGCTQHAAMRRVAVPGTPLAARGQITELRLAQIVAVIALASFAVPTMDYMGVHEPNRLGYASGANIITAESGANPRDTQIDTAKSRGMDLAACRRMLYESGFTGLRRGDESVIRLDLEYLRATGSMV